MLDQRPKQAAATGTAGDAAIRPFRVEVPDEALADLRRRVESMISGMRSGGP